MSDVVMFVFELSMMYSNTGCLPRDCVLLYLVQTRASLESPDWQVTFQLSGGHFEAHGR